MSDSDTLRAVANWLAGNHPEIMMNESDELYRIADTIERKAPSDEEIEDMAERARDGYSDHGVHGYKDCAEQNFIKGAEWARDKMTGK